MTISVLQSLLLRVERVWKMPHKQQRWQMLPAAAALVDVAAIWFSTHGIVDASEPESDISALVTSVPGGNGCIHT